MNFVRELFMVLCEEKNIIIPFFKFIIYTVHVQSKNTKSEVLYTHMYFRRSINYDFLNVAQKIRL